MDGVTRHKGDIEFGVGVEYFVRSAVEADRSRNTPDVVLVATSAAHWLASSFAARVMGGNSRVRVSRCRTTPRRHRAL